MQPNGVRRAVALLRDDEFRNPFVLRVLVVHLITIDERDDVGVLLDRAGLAQIREHRPLVGARLGPTVELRKCDHGNVELLGQTLEPAADLRNLLLAPLCRAVGAGQLEVVDDHEIEASLGRDASRLGLDLEHTGCGAIIDEDLGFGEATRRVHQALVIVHGDETPPERCRIDACLGGEQPQHERTARHLEREDGDPLGVIRGGVARDVECERRLAHGRSCGNDDEFAGLESARDLVEILETGGKSGQLPSPIHQRLDEIERLVDFVVELAERLPAPGLADLEHLALGEIEQPVCVLRLLESHLDHLGRDSDQRSLDGFVSHDSSVVENMRGRGFVVDELREHRVTPHGVELLVA